MVTEVRRQAEAEKEIAINDTKKKKWVSRHLNVHACGYMYIRVRGVIACAIGVGGSCFHLIHVSDRCGPL